MISKLKTFIQIYKIMKSGQNIGDAAALKLKITGNPEEETPFTKEVRELENETFKTINLEKLKALPKDTFGYQYFNFLKKNSLTPLNFSSTSREIFGKYPIGVRYIRTHDMFHVILGFDPSPAGELGVYTFIREQNYSKQLTRAAKTANFVSKLLFWQSTKMNKARSKGLDLAKNARPLITIPFERHFEEEVAELKNRWL